MDILINYIKICNTDDFRSLYSTHMSYDISGELLNATVKYDADEIFKYLIELYCTHSDIKLFSKIFKDFNIEQLIILRRKSFVRHICGVNNKTSNYILISVYASAYRHDWMWTISHIEASNCNINIPALLYYACREDMPNFARHIVGKYAIHVPPPTLNRMLTTLPPRAAALLLRFM